MKAHIANRCGYPRSSPLHRRETIQGKQQTHRGPQHHHGGTIDLDLDLGQFRIGHGTIRRVRRTFRGEFDSRRFGFLAAATAAAAAASTAATFTVLIADGSFLLAFPPSRARNLGSNLVTAKQATKWC